MIPDPRATRILMYHGFTEEALDHDPENLFVTRRALEQQLAMVRRRGWRFLDADGYLDVRAGRRSGRGTALLTIDDALESVADIAAPVLAAAGVPAVLFVPVGLIGGPATWMTEYPTARIADAARLRQIAASGIELGVHGYDHVNMVGLGDAALAQATGEARDRLAELCGRPPRLFAYPYGANDERARRAVRAAGFELGFSVFDDAGAMAISRVDINATDTPWSFRLKCVPGYRAAWRLASRTPAVRAGVRRAVTAVRR